ncbi:MAG: efflux RND transporter permease subunit, partial [Abitibacteriaceae bacterium]|nr:efflux RND transporter permease subunit [Abditibacteriaceae bacterium]
LVVALSIPISVISTFALLYMCGFTLNTMSLGGLALATGLIVDDAVVVLENIFRHIERDKKSAFEAAISGTQEIASAVVASTITIMVVFLPLFLIKGQAGQMFTQFALVVIFSMAISLLDATTVVPMLASRLIHGETHHENNVDLATASFTDRLFARLGMWFDALDASYRNGLQWALGHRLWVVGGAIAISAATFLIVPQVGTEMMPQTDSGDFSITVKMPIGTALDKTNATIQKVEQIVQQNPNVETAFAASGTTLSLRGTTTSLNPNQGSVQVKLKDQRKDSTMQVMTDLRKQISRLPGVRPLVNQIDLVTQIMTGGNQNVEVDIFGQDLGQLSELGKQVSGQMRSVPGLENVDVNWQEATPELQWKVDRQKALQFGLSFSDIANTLNTATNGTIASYYQEKGFQYPIIVQMPEQQRKTLAELENIKVGVAKTSNATTENTSSTAPDASPSSSILLRQVATPVYGFGPSEITRMNRQRYIAVSGQPQGRSASEVQAEVQKILGNVQMPTGYYWDWGLNQKRQAEEFSGMGVAVILAICLIYMLLASQFESFVHPLTILLSVPFSAIGVVLALFLSGRAFGLTAFVGLLMLVGIVVKNGILLVDYTNALRLRGIDRNEAVLTAGPTRLRPILMTTCAAVLGMMPIAIGIGKGSETQAPMATAVIGGLITSTMLTLFVVPTVYTIFDDLSLRFATRSIKGATAEPHAGVDGVAPMDGVVATDGVPAVITANGHATVNGNGVAHGHGMANGNGTHADHSIVASADGHHAPAQDGNGSHADGNGVGRPSDGSNGHSPKENITSRDS